jgi:hypothetical protein
VVGGLGPLEKITLGSPSISEPFFDYQELAMVLEFELADLAVEEAVEFVACFCFLCVHTRLEFRTGACKMRFRLGVGIELSVGG